MTELRKGDRVVRVATGEAGTVVEQRTGLDYRVAWDAEDFAVAQRAAVLAQIAELEQGEQYDEMDDHLGPAGEVCAACGEPVFPEDRPHYETCPGADDAEDEEVCAHCGSTELQHRVRFGRSRGEQQEYYVDVICTECGAVDFDTEGGI